MSRYKEDHGREYDLCRDCMGDCTEIWEVGKMEGRSEQETLCVQGRLANSLSLAIS